MNKQITLSAFNDELAQVRTKNKELLAQMNISGLYYYSMKTRQSFRLDLCYVPALQPPSSYLHHTGAQA